MTYVLVYRTRFTTWQSACHAIRGTSNAKKRCSVCGGHIGYVIRTMQDGSQEVWWDDGEGT